MERWKGKQEAAEDILGGFQRALVFCTWLWIALILADCLKLMTMLERSKGKHEVTEDLSADVQEALHLMDTAVDSL